MTPRKHAELIKAWAYGAEIQFLETWGEWTTVEKPGWYEGSSYRIKPVPKADYVRMGALYFMDAASPHIPVNVTFSGETGEPKKVEIIK